MKLQKIAIKNGRIDDSVFTVKKNLYICIRLTGGTNVKEHWADVATGEVRKLIYAGIAQLVEHDLAKVGVASPSLVSRSE